MDDAQQAGPGPQGRAARWGRVRFVVGAVVATAVAAVFGTVGDGVPAAEGGGVRALVVDHAHTLTWVLLALACGVAAVRGRWSAPSQVLAVGGGAVYVVFLLTVFVLR